MTYPTISLPHREFRDPDGLRHRANALEIERFLSELDRRVAVLESYPVRLYAATASSDLILGTAHADIPGCTVSFDTTVTSATVLVVGTADCDVTTAGTGFCNAYTHLSSVGTNDFACAFEDRLHREWAPIEVKYTTGAPGTYTVKLRGNKNAAGGAAALKTNCRLSVLVIG